MKVFKVVVQKVLYLTIDPASADDLEAWEHCLGEDGTFDTGEIENDLVENGTDDLDADSETITVSELSEKEAKYYLDNQ